MTGGLHERLLHRFLFDATTLAQLGPRRVKQTIETLAPETTKCPELLRLPLAPEAGYLSQRDYTTPMGQLSVCRNMIYYTHLNSIFASRRTLVLDGDNTFREHPAESLAQAFYWRPRFVNPTQTIPGHAAILRSSANNYYHTLVDNLPRLWGLHHPKFSDVAIQLLVPSSLQIAERFFLDKLLPPNVRVRTVENDVLHMPETLLVSSFLSRQMSGYLPHRWLDFFHARVLPVRSRDKRHRIYISRRATRTGRRILNEDEVIDALSHFGVQRYELETLPPEAQIDLFFDAELVVAPHGAGLTNLLFAHCVDVVELHPTQQVMPHYFLLGLALGHRYRYLGGNANQRHGNFRVDIPALERLLTEIDRKSRPT